VVTVHLLHTDDGHTYLTDHVASGYHQHRRDKPLTATTWLRQPTRPWVGTGLGVLGEAPGRADDSGELLWLSRGPTAVRGEKLGNWTGHTVQVTTGPTSTNQPHGTSPWAIVPFAQVCRRDAACQQGEVRGRGCDDN
jgi:hypothetical protein